MAFTDTEAYCVTFRDILSYRYHETIVGCILSFFYPRLINIAKYDFPLLLSADIYMALLVK